MKKERAVPDEAEQTDRRSRALKERIYAIFTGLSILAATSVAAHSTAREALLAVAVGVFGISIAGFLAEVIAHQTTHRRLPGTHELAVMAQIALGAFLSAFAPVLVLVASALGLLTVEHALQFGMLVYAVSLIFIVLLAARRSGLRAVQRLLSTIMLLGLAGLVVAVLTLAHA
jgi:hypothetical protein